MYIYTYIYTHTYWYACIYIHAYIYGAGEMHRQKFQHKGDDTQFYLCIQSDILQNNIILMVSLMVAIEP